jgi:hypothetical protein
MTHGLTDEAARIAQAMGVDPSQLPPAPEGARVLLPPEAVCTDQSNWPLLNMSKVSGAGLVCVCVCVCVCVFS